MSFDPRQTLLSLVGKYRDLLRHSKHNDVKTYVKNDFESKGLEGVEVCITKSTTNPWEDDDAEHQVAKIPHQQYIHVKFLAPGAPEEMPEPREVNKSAAQHQLRAASTRIARLTATLDVKEREVDSFKATVARLRDALDQRDAQIESMQKVVNAKESLRKQIRTMENEQQRLTQDKERAEELLQFQTQEKIRAEQLLEGCMMSIASGMNLALEDEVESLKEQVASLDRELADKEDALIQELEHNKMLMQVISGYGVPIGVPFNAINHEFMRAK